MLTIKRMELLEYLSHYQLHGCHYICMICDTWRHFFYSVFVIRFFFLSDICGEVLVVNGQLS